MDTYLLPLFNWLGETSMGKAVADSKYAFAIIEVFHLLGIVLLLGGASLMALRLLGLSMKQQTVPELSRQVGGYTFIGLLTMLITGIMMTSSIPNKYYHSVPFWWKMAFFLIGVVFHFTLYRKVTHSEKNSFGMAWLTAGLAIIIWYTTAVLGRAIGFY